MCVKSDRAGEDESIVVVGMLADEIYASGCPENFWMRVEFLFEDLRQKALQLPTVDADVEKFFAATSA